MFDIVCKDGMLSFHVFGNFGSSSPIISSFYSRHISSTGDSRGGDGGCRCCRGRIPDSPCGVPHPIVVCL